MQSKEVMQSGYSNLIKFEDYKDYINSIIKSGALPSDCKTAEQVFTKISYGAELGFKPHQSLHFITQINGTNTVNAKGVGELYRLHKYQFKLIRNAEYIYSYNGKEIYSPRLLPLYDLLPLLNISKEDFSSFPEPKKAAVGNPVDRVTTIEYWKEGETFENYKNTIFNEVINKLKTEISSETLFNILQEIKPIKNSTHSYYWSMAVKAELTEKDTYKKYPADMMLHRCKVSLSKVLGILTQPETEEVSNYENVAYQIIE